MSLRVAYHEAAHALTARDLGRRTGRRIESVALVPGGGVLRQEPIGPNATDEQIELALVAVLAGNEGEKYAPERSWQQGDDPWLTIGELAMHEPVPDEAEKRPTDEEVIEHYSKRIGPEAVERAREFAVEYVERLYRTGRLERLADEILLRGHLTADDVERLLGAPA